MYTLYLDMDGVLSDFNKGYAKIDPHKEDRERFRSAVIDHKIFETLDFMPDAFELTNHVSKLDSVRIEILTSVGTFDSYRGNLAKYQKLAWLDKNNLPYKANFVRCKNEKSSYAHDRAILIDDSIGCITPFNVCAGHGILHVSSKNTISQLTDVIRKLDGDSRA